MTIRKQWPPHEGAEAMQAPAQGWRTACCSVRHNGGIATAPDSSSKKTRTVSRPGRKFLQLSFHKCTDAPSRKADRKTFSAACSGRSET